MERVWAWIEMVLRRYPWAITLAALVPCAYFNAAGVNHLVALGLFKTDLTALTRPAPPSPADREAMESPVPSHHVRELDRILARNVFDSAAGCLNCAPPPEAAPEDAESAQALEDRPPEPCDGQSKVTGAVEVQDPLWSFVFVAPGAGQAALPYRVGQTVEGRTVASIGWHQRYGAFVVLRQAGAPRCFYAQNMPERSSPPPPPPVAATPSPGPGGPNSELAAALDQGIERSGANQFNVQRSLVDRILENQAELMRTTRIMPHEEGGRVVGVQLFGVRGNSLLGRLGMQNGDVLNRINGLEIATPDRALEAYSRLRTADHITVSVTRGGTPVNLDFSIR